jgi:hypothetical protein
MAKWNLSKSERKTHDSGTETTTYSADVILEGDDASNQLTLGELATLIENLTTVDGIPSTAKLSATITAPLRWTDEDL